MLEFMTFYRNALHLTRVYCNIFYKTALRHEEFEDVTRDVTLPSPCPFSRGFLLVVMFCSGLPVKRREEDRA